MWECIFLGLMYVLGIFVLDIFVCVWDVVLIVDVVLYFIDFLDLILLGCYYVLIECVFVVRELGVNVKVLLGG